MKKIRKKRIIIISCICLIILGGIIYFMGNNKVKDIPLTKGITIVPTMDDKITTDSSWCATFQLVWNDMKKEIVKTDVVFNPQLEMVENLNKESFTEDMLSDEYYFKIYGLKTKKLKEEIEKGIKEKFNQTSDILKDFDWSEEALDDPTSSDIRRYFFYTMLYREFEYKSKFSVLDNANFGEYEDIKYFGVNKNSKEAVRKQIEVLFYNSKEEFALKLKTKSGDEVIFYKNPDGKTFREIYDNMMRKANEYEESRDFSEKDFFMAPILSFNVKREYKELENKKFNTADGNIAMIEKAIQSIKFSLDETGGKVKSEAGVDSWKTTSMAGEEKTRYFNVNDTFALFLKEETKDIPYLALRVDDITKYQNN